MCSVREYFEKEKANEGPLISVNKVLERTAAAVSYTHLDVYKRQVNNYD